MRNNRFIALLKARTTYIQYYNTTMERKSVSDSVDEITDSVTNTPTLIHEFEKISDPSIIEKHIKREDELESMDQLKTKNPFYFFSKNDISFLISAILFNSLSAVTDVASTIMINEMFSKLTNFQSGHYKTPSDFLLDVQWPCFSIILIGLGTALFGWFETLFFTYLGERQQVRFRKHLLISLFSRNLNYFENNSNLDGDLIQLNRSVEEFRSSISEYLSVLCKSIFSMTCLIIISMYYSWKLTLLMMSVFPFIFVSIKVFGGQIQKWAKKEDDETSKAISLLDWNFCSFIWIKIIYSKDSELKSFNSLIQNCEYTFRQFCIFANIVSSIMKTLSLMLFVQSFWFGSYLVRTKQNSSGDIISAFYSCLKLAMTISRLSMIAVIYQKANTSFKKVLKFSLSLDAIKIFSKSLDKPDEQLYGDIKFNNVCFGYNNNKESKVLDSVSLDIEPFKTTYILGKSGSGKSTIANLLLGLYKPLTGSIQIDGHDIDSLNIYWLRDQITLVQQFPKIFNDTIENNILLGTPYDDINTPFVKESIQFFNFDTVISDLSDGVKTYIGRSDDTKNKLTQLSGGQEQRLNLVKAKLRDSNILILDESISALDIKSRELFMEKINSWRNNKTTIIITHELSHIRDHDMVYFIENGRIVESGKKSELKNMSGKFANFQIQDSINIKDNNKMENSNKRNSIFDQIDHFESNNKDLENSIGTEKGEVPKIANTEKIDSIRTPILIAFKLLIKNLSTKYKFFYLFGLFLIMIDTVLTPIFTFCFSHLIEGIIPESQTDLLSTHEQLKWSIIATAVAIVTGLVGFFSETILDFAAQRLSRNIQLESLRKILKQCVEFFDNSNSNELSTLIMNDIRDFRRIFSSNLARLVSGVTVSIVCIVWTLTTGWKYALVGFSFFPLFGIFSFICTAITQKSEFNYKDSLNVAESIVYESRVGIKTIMCLNIQEHFIRNFDDKLRIVLKNGFRRSVTMGFSINSVFLIVNISQSVMFYYGFKLIAEGEYTLIQMMQIIMMIMMSVMVISQLLSSASGLYRGLRVALKLNQLLSLKSDDEIQGGYLTPNLQLLQTPDCIQFKHVTFAYPTDEKKLVLNDFNMNIPANQFVSIVGESGCGKSTIVSLILRLHLIRECSSGYNASNHLQNILIDGYDINTIKLSWLMSNIAVVTQKHYFFNGTIKENLLYGNSSRHSISDSDILKILEKLELSELIEESDDGLNSLLCVSGNLLVSGGQAQRLSIARALLRPASIIILDEFTSSLDVQSTAIVLNMIDDIKLRDKKTIICITHQEKVMRRSDLVFYVKDGKVTEKGNFETLFRNGGDLYNMVKNTNF